MSIGVWDENYQFHDNTKRNKFSETFADQLEKYLIFNVIVILQIIANGFDD